MLISQYETMNESRSFIIIWLGSEAIFTLMLIFLICFLVQVRIVCNISKCLCEIEVIKSIVFVEHTICTINCLISHLWIFMVDE